MSRLSWVLQKDMVFAVYKGEMRSCINGTGRISFDERSACCNVDLSNSDYSNRCISYTKAECLCIVVSFLARCPTRLPF